MYDNLVDLDVVKKCQICKNKNKLGMYKGKYLAGLKIDYENENEPSFLFKYLVYCNDKKCIKKYKKLHKHDKFIIKTILDKYLSDEDLRFNEKEIKGLDITVFMINNHIISKNKNLLKLRDNKKIDNLDNYFEEV